MKPVKPPRYSEIIHGHLVEVRLRRTKPEGNHIEALVYPGTDNCDEPMAEWVMPYELRYYLPDVARAALGQTDTGEDPANGEQ